MEKGTPTCPTCGNIPEQGRIVHKPKKEAMRLVRRGLAELAGMNKVGRGSTMDSSIRAAHLRSSYIVRNRTHVVCRNTFHDVMFKHACQFSCTSRGSEIAHWHEPSPGKVPCDGKCFNHKYDSDDEYDVKYSSPEGYEESHYHNRLDLPRQHDAGKASRKLRRNLTRQAKSKR